MPWRSLPDAQRVVMLLVAVEGLSYREAAEILEIPIGTVMSRLSRARLSIGAQFSTMPNHATPRPCFQEGFSHMNFDDTLLMAYVDGALPLSRCTEITEAVEHSSELAGRVAQLRASILPYKDAFTYQGVPPVPDSLSRFIAQLAQNLAPGGEAGADAAADGMNPAGQTNPLPPARGDDDKEAAAPVGPTLATVHTPTFGARPPRSRHPSAWLAAAFVAGAFFCGAVLKVNPHLFSFGRASPWIEAAAGVSGALYARNARGRQRQPALNARVLDEIHRQDGLPLAVPDLQNAGLTFKRLQRLRFHGKPLVQIVYLPAHGEPVALCVVKSQLADSPRGCSASTAWTS